jgi:tRNA(fMet)-specific endonuclease VapC
LAYLIDTNIAIHAFDALEPVLAKFAEHEGAILLSALSLAELQRGLSVHPELTILRRERLQVLLQAVPVAPFDAKAAEIYGEIIAAIGRVKRRDFDRLIAAHALALGCVLVTANVADFSDIPGLRIEDWTSGA